MWKVAGLVAALLATNSTGFAAPVEWKVAEGGNGHFYEPFAPGVISWTDADAAATALGGHLVTLTSAAENEFVFDLIDSETYWAPFIRADGQLQVHGPWIGLFQLPGAPEPDMGWLWVTGEPFVFNAWGTGEPNGQPTENFGEFFGGPADGSVRVPLWNDRIDVAVVPANASIAYVVEFAPEPPSPLLAAMVALALAVGGRARLGRDRA